MIKKPDWVIEKEQRKREENRVWLFGIHAVRDALANPRRVKRSLLVTKNAHHKLSDVINDCPFQIFDPHHFRPPIDRQSVHQGAVLEVEPLNWGGIESLYPQSDREIVVILDRVSDPHNVGAILRSSEVLGARAVIAPHRYSSPETGALAKTASGALERQPYLRVPNLGNAMQDLKKMGYVCIGLDGLGNQTLDETLLNFKGPTALVLGSEGPGMRERTRKECDFIAQIPYASEFGSLNVSNAAAIALYAARQKRVD